LLFAALQSTLAQRTLTGKAINAVDGFAMPEVSVVIKDTTTGVTTDATGNFYLNVPNNSRATIIVSFTGFKTVEVPVGSYRQFNITLQPDTTVLGEIIVTARKGQRERVITAMGIKYNSRPLPPEMFRVPSDQLKWMEGQDLWSALVVIVPGFEVRVGGNTTYGYYKRSTIGNFVIDGIKYNAYNDDSFALHIDASSIESVTVHARRVFEITTINNLNR